MAHSDDEYFHTERAKAFHDIGDWTSKFASWGAYKHSLFVDAICDLEYIERKRKLPADLEVLSLWVNQTDSQSKNPSFF